MLLFRYYQLLSRFMVNDQFSRFSNQSRPSENIKGVNGVKLRVVHRYPGICLMAEENPGNLQLEDHVVMAVRLVIATNVV